MGISIIIVCVIVVFIGCLCGVLSGFFVVFINV